MGRVKKIEIILFSGFLGAGKTTILSRLIPEFAKDKRLALLINDFGSMSLDGKLLKKYNMPQKEIAGGSIFCICKQANLIQQLTEIAEEIQPDILLIEASGLAEPTDTAALLQNTFLRDIYSLPKVITVVDAVNFSKLRHILKVIEMQIQIADVIIVSKIDLVKDNKTIENEIRLLNNRAEIIFSDFATLYGEVAFADYEDVKTEASLRLCATATTGFSTVNWSDSSIVSKLTKEKLNPLLDEYKDELLRAKGILNGEHLELVNGEYVWESSTIENSTNGIFFALKNDLNKQFNLKIKEILK